MQLTEEQQARLVKNLENFARSNHQEVLQAHRESNSLDSNAIVSLYVNDRLINAINEIQLLLESCGISLTDVDDVIQEEIVAIYG